MVCVIRYRLALGGENQLIALRLLVNHGVLQHKIPRGTDENDQRAFPGYVTVLGNNRQQQTLLELLSSSLCLLSFLLFVSSVNYFFVAVLCSPESTPRNLQVPLFCAPSCFVLPLRPFPFPHGLLQYRRFGRCAWRKVLLSS